MLGRVSDRVLVDRSGSLFAMVSAIAAAMVASLPAVTWGAIGAVGSLFCRLGWGVGCWWCFALWCSRVGVALHGS